MRTKLHDTVAGVASQKAQPLLGILGGMGPLATAHFYRLLVERTPAEVDQQHLAVAIWADPSIPDRTAALLGDGPSPVPAMLRGLGWLRAAGADCIAIPCNTAHAFVDELARVAGVEILHIAEVALGAAQAAGPRPCRVGVLATAGTRRARLYEEPAERLGIDVVPVSAEIQERIDAAISAVKAGQSPAASAPQLRDAVERVAAAGADVAIAACTELSLILPFVDSPLPVVDSTASLADAALLRLHPRC